MRSFAIAALESTPTDAWFDRIASLVDAGVDRILIRDPKRPDRERLQTARRCREIVTGSTLLFVHGRADLALAAGADGLHLPSWGIPAEVARRLAPGLLIGRSCHSLADCRAAAASGTDYVFLGPVFPPRSKEGEGGVDRGELPEAARLGPDVFALGGMTIENVAQLRGLPIAGVAGITLFMEDRPVAAVVEAVRRS
ncbi:MAG TPA: thiamine phosphate synthase [Thermoanaerobaculia bacterium]|nr:thiamine phosphate synthase [Thermoanaerobaculia bacterium]